MGCKPSKSTTDSSSSNTERETVKNRPSTSSQSQEQQQQQQQQSVPAAAFAAVKQAAASPAVRAAIVSAVTGTQLTAQQQLELDLRSKAEANRQNREAIEATIPVARENTSTKTTSPTSSMPREGNAKDEAPADGETRLRADQTTSAAKQQGVAAPKPAGLSSGTVAAVATAAGVAAAGVKSIVTGDTFQLPTSSADTSSQPEPPAKEVAAAGEGEGIGGTSNGDEASKQRGIVQEGDKQLKRLAAGGATTAAGGRGAAAAGGRALQEGNRVSPTRSTSSVSMKDYLDCRSECDSLRADVRRLTGQLQDANTEYMYLKGAVEAAENPAVANAQPPYWVQEQQHVISQLRAQLLRLDQENIILRHNARATLNEEHRSGEHPASPRQLVEEVQRLQKRIDELRTVEQESVQATQRSQQDLERAQQELTALHRQRDTAVRQWEQERTKNERDAQMRYDELEARQKSLEATHSQRLAELREENLRVVAALRTEVETLTATRDALSREIGDAEAVKQLAAAEQSKTGSHVSEFLQDIAAVLVPAEHCPDSVRLQLLQYVCEHAGRVVAGRPKMVSDPTTFDMNGVPYGDCVAHLASLVLQRPDSRVSTLVVSDTQMTDLGVATLALTLAALPFETPLRVLNLSSNDITARGALQLVTAISGTAHSNRTFRAPLDVDLDNNPIFDDAAVEGRGSWDIAVALIGICEKLSPAHRSSSVTVTLPAIPKALQQWRRAQLRNAATSA